MQGPSGPQGTSFHSSHSDHCRPSPLPDRLGHGCSPRPCVLATACSPIHDIVQWHPLRLMPAVTSRKPYRRSSDAVVTLPLRVASTARLCRRVNGFLSPLLGRSGPALVHPCKPHAPAPLMWPATGGSGPLLVARPIVQLWRYKAPFLARINTNCDTQPAVASDVG